MEGEVRVRKGRLERERRQTHKVPSLTVYLPNNPPPGPPPRRSSRFPALGWSGMPKYAFPILSRYLHKRKRTNSRVEPLDKGSLIPKSS